MHAVNRATAVENAGYAGDYKSKIKAVPPLFTADARNADDAHRFFQSAMSEYKKYFKTQNALHVKAGEQGLVMAAMLQTKTIESLNKKLAGLTR